MKTACKTTPVQEIVLRLLKGGTVVVVPTNIND